MKKILLTVLAVILSFSAHAGEFDSYLKALDNCRLVYQQSLKDYKLQDFQNYSAYSQVMIDKGIEAAECYKIVGYKVIEKFYGKDASALKESLNKITAKSSSFIQNSYADYKSCQEGDCKKGANPFLAEKISEQVSSLVEKLIKGAEFLSKKE